MDNITYTSTVNSDPGKAAYGQQDATGSNAIQTLQQSLNAKGAQLRVDGKYGPLTQAANTKYNPPANPGIVSSTQARTDLATGGNTLDTLTTQPDPYLEYLQKKAQNLVTNPSVPGADEKSAQANSSVLQNKAEENYKAYKAGLETLGIQTGLSEHAPGLQADKMLNAANSETDKIAAIQDKENLAIAKAKEARQNKDSVALKDTLAEIKSIRSDKRQALQDSLNRPIQEGRIAAGIASSVNEQLKSIPANQKEAFLQHIADTHQITDPTILHAALIKDQNTTTKEALSNARQLQLLNAVKASKGGFTFTPTTKIALIGKGMNNADVKGVEADINKYGINQVLDNKNSGLSDDQKTALKTIFGVTDIKASNKSWWQNLF